MRMSYVGLRTDERSGSTLADYLASIEACFSISIDGREVINDAYFPVAELARKLLLWVKSEGTLDFSFDSSSYEELGIVTFKRKCNDWVVSSVFNTDDQDLTVSWVSLQEAISEFVTELRDDLCRAGIDGRYVLGE